MDFSLGVAVSDSPAGPFVQYTNVPGEPGYDADNRTLTVDLPFLSNEDMWYWLKEHKSEYYTAPAGEESNPGQMTAGEPITTMIDVHPFLDPKTGENICISFVTFRAAAEALPASSRWAKSGRTIPFGKPLQDLPEPDIILSTTFLPPINRTTLSKEEPTKDLTFIIMQR